MQAYYAMAYNPYGPTRAEYRWSFGRMYTPFADAVLVGHEFWDIIGGPTAYAELLDIYQEVGCEKGKYMLDALAADSMNPCTHAPRSTVTPHVSGKKCAAPRRPAGRISNRRLAPDRNISGAPGRASSAERPSHFKEETTLAVLAAHPFYPAMWKSNGRLVYEV